MSRVSIKHRTSKNREYLINKVRSLYRDALSTFENNMGEQPDIIFTSPNIIRYIAHNRDQIVTVDEYDGRVEYFQSKRIFYVRTNIIVLSICDGSKINAMDSAKIINDFDYDLLYIIDKEYENRSFLKKERALS